MHGSNLVKRKIVGREQWGYRSRQIPRQSGHFVWGKDLGFPRLGRRPLPLTERSSRQWKRGKTCHSEEILYFSLKCTVVTVISPAQSTSFIQLFAVWRYKICNWQRFETLHVGRTTSSQWETLNQPWHAQMINMSSHQLGNLKRAVYNFPGC